MLHERYQEVPRRQFIALNTFVRKEEIERKIVKFLIYEIGKIIY